jgi:hypothetical protein
MTYLARNMVNTLLSSSVYISDLFFKVTIDLFSIGHISSVMYSSETSVVVHKF